MMQLGSNTRSLSNVILCMSALLSISAAELHATCESSDLSSMPSGYAYEGLIDDKFPIRLVMDLGYAYNTSDHIIPLRSETTTTGGVSHVKMTELDDAGTPRAVFEGTFQDEDPRKHYSKGATLKCDVITGEWKSLKDGKSLPFYLKGNSSLGWYERRGEGKQIDGAAIRFRRAVLGGDKKKVASSIRYPIFVSLDGDEKKQRKIKTAEELATVYDRIFVARFVQRIREDVPLLMFDRDQGIMLGDGEVWFNEDGEVIALNNYDRQEPTLIEGLLPR